MLLIILGGDAAVPQINRQGTVTQTLNSASGCLQACISSQNCVSFVVDSCGNKCYLQSNLGTVAFGNCMSSGVIRSRTTYGKISQFFHILI